MICKQPENTDFPFIDYTVIGGDEFSGLQIHLKTITSSIKFFLGNVTIPPALAIMHGSLFLVSPFDSIIRN